MINKNKLKLATVFSGIGAIEFALKRLDIDYELIFACDNNGIDIDIDYDNELKKIRDMKDVNEKNEYVRQLYKNNTRRTNFVEITYLENYKIPKNKFFYDIKLLDGMEFNNKIDLLVGGSPCQSFSTLGNRLGIEDARGTLFYDYARLIKETNPRYFIFENVYNIMKHDKGKTWEVIINVFKTLGYFLKIEMLNSADYGIPQNRRRVFVIGFKNKEDSDKYCTPQKKELLYKAQDFLINNVPFKSFTSKNGELILNKKKGNIPEETILSEKIQKYVMSSGTKNFHSKPKLDLEIAKTILASMGNRHRAGIDNYYSLPNDKVRSLHYREAARLMGFTDDFVFTVSKSQAIKQIGNSIVVDVLMNIIKAMKIDEEYQKRT